jgi:hypothetical protein
MIQIENAQTLSDLFGHWPDFHDAEVITLRLDATEHSGPQLEVEFEVAEMSSEVDERGYFKDRQRVRTTLRFDRVARLRLSDFLEQNVLGSLELSEAAADEYDEMYGTGPRGRRKYRVKWDSSVGCEADFLCDTIEVLAASAFARAI